MMIGLLLGVGKISVLPTLLRKFLQLKIGFASAYRCCITNAHC